MSDEKQYGDYFPSTQRTALLAQVKEQEEQITVLQRAVSALVAVKEHCEEDCPGEYRTRHLTDAMFESDELLDELRDKGFWPPKVT